VREFLTMEMKMNIDKEEMRIVRIFSPRRENSETLYVEFTIREDVRKIYRRAAVIKNRKANLSNFIPPELFDRLRVAENQCYRWRREEEGWKTKIVMGEEDIVVMRKRRGDSRFKEVDMRYIEELPNMNMEAREEAPAREEVISPAIGSKRGGNVGSEVEEEGEEEEGGDEEEGEGEEEDSEAREDVRKRKTREGSQGSQGESPKLQHKRGR
jgi:hypothetical protein